MRPTETKELRDTASIAEENGDAIAIRLRDLAVECLDDAKAENILPLDIRGRSAIADFMIIASGRSSRHVTAVCDQLLRALKEAGHGTSRVEGLASGDWVLIDAGDVVIHVFRPEVREFYALEKMWSEPDAQAATIH